MMGDINELVLGVLARAPQWVRQDLLSSDAVIRARAEETLAAMISSVLAGAGTDASDAGVGAEDLA